MKSAGLSCEAQNERGKRTKEALQQTAEQEFVQTCTFRPEVSVQMSQRTV